MVNFHHACLAGQMVDLVDVGEGVRSVPCTTRAEGSRRDGAMPTRTHTVNAVEAEQLSAAFNSCFENLAAPDGLFAPDAFFDLLPPFWRFQLQGPDAFIAQLRAIAEGEITSRVVRVVPSATGFVMEHEETMRGAKTEVARKIWLCDVADGRITAATCYCNGGWDDDLRARHAAEAPMIRP